MVIRLILKQMFYLPQRGTLPQRVLLKPEISKIST